MNSQIETLNGAEIVVRHLLRKRVEVVFAYIGGSVIPLFDALGQSCEPIRLIRPNHEQGGVHAADGYSRVCGKPGVVITTSGPGALNTLTGIGTAFMDSIPLIVITGQVSTAKLGSDAFQESDIVGMSASVTKGSRMVRHIEDLDRTLHWAFNLANSGRKGPVLVDIPVDIQNQKTAYFEKDRDLPEDRFQVPREKLDCFSNMLREAEAPLLLCGGGAISAGVAEELASFAEKHRIPVVSTLLGRGLPLRSPELDLGGIGMHGAVFANMALHHTDLLIICGSRLSDRILTEANSIAPLGRIVQFDIDPAEIGKVKSVDLGIVADLGLLRPFFKELRGDVSRTRTWLSKIDQWRRNYPLQAGVSAALIKAQHAIVEIQKRRNPDGIVVADVGQHQMWAAQFLQIRHPRTFLTSGGLGTMGYALPAAMGAQLACPGREVLALCGDGGFAMNMQELETLRRYNLPVKVLVIDNRGLGMVRQWQKLLCSGRHVETHAFGEIDYEGLARAFGIWSLSCKEPRRLGESLDAFFQVNGPALLHVQTDSGEDVLPMVPIGTAINRPLTQIEQSYRT